MTDEIHGFINLKVFQSFLGVLQHLCHIYLRCSGGVKGSWWVKGDYLSVDGGQTLRQGTLGDGLDRVTVRIRSQQEYRALPDLIESEAVFNRGWFHSQRIFLPGLKARNPDGLVSCVAYWHKKSALGSALEAVLDMRGCNSG